ncbi:hypothetical protein [Nocardia terpenica]|uniref:Uncharacterized protein n=1 Tax=Nocardia terpenica TaxID=455432 RepID=A0A6G9ZEF3_9NOCA|nr:hypothetical protein [Nocardia terpenica]QIS23727.1 hypothetical protein F6W96_41045 [Nocardia terpenica]
MVEEAETCFAAASSISKGFGRGPGGRVLVHAAVVGLATLGREVPVQGGFRDAGSLPDLRQGLALTAQQPRVLDLLLVVGDGAADAPARRFGDREGVRGAFGGEGALHLREQRQQQAFPVCALDRVR